MKIIVDAFGGDNAPVEVIKGCAMAVENYGVEIVLVGNICEMRKVAEENAIVSEKITMVDAQSVIMVEDDPLDILKAKADCSMAVGLKLVASGEGDAFVSAGSTAALVVGASSIVKRIKGIKRAALAPIIPSDNGAYMLMDAGANVECRPEMLQQFGIMGSCYMNKIMGITSPRVGLTNVGVEDNKGRELDISAHKLLSNAPVNFIGNIEARDIPLGGCDVAVTDGFTGNMILKLTEGMGKFISNNLNSMFKAGLTTKLAALIMMPKLRGFKKKMDYTEHGGAPLMGVAKPVIKAHGSSNAKAFMNAIRQARDFAQKDVIGEITASLEIIRNQEQSEAQQD